MAKAERRQSRELRLLQEDPCFEESKNVRRSEFKCEECSLSFHRKTSYDSHMMVNHKKKEEMAQIWKQIDRPDHVSVKLKPRKTDVKHKIVVGLDGKVVKKYKAGIVELRKDVNATSVSNVIKSGNVRLVTPSTSGLKPKVTGTGKSTWNSQPLTFDNKGIQCLNCKHYFKNSFEFGVHTTRVEHRVPCQICFQSFENQCHLKRHQRIAHPHVCNMCDKLFSTDQHLDLHRKVSHRIMYQRLKADNPKQMASTSGSKAKNNQITTIVISDSEDDPSPHKKLKEAPSTNSSSKHKLSAKDMMQNLASIAKSTDKKDPFTNMLSVMLEKPAIKKTPVMYTTSRPVIGMPVVSVTKPVQPVQTKITSVNSSTASTTTGLSSFLGQHVTSTVYSNLRPKGSFNLGKQVERVNLACRLAQHKQSLELKKLLKRHPQYQINDKDLKFKIPLGNLSEEFDECPLFPTEADIKVRTSNYTISPLLVLNDSDHVGSLCYNNNAIQHMFNEAVDSCVLQEAWKLTHSTSLRRRSRDVTSYSLKQKQECILDLHVQLLAIRNAAQTIVNKALVKHITELKQAGKEMAAKAEAKNNQNKPTDSMIKEQASQNDNTKNKSDNEACQDPINKESGQSEVNESSEKTTKQLSTHQEKQQSQTADKSSNEPEDKNRESKSDSDLNQDKPRGPKSVSNQKDSSSNSNLAESSDTKTIVDSTNDLNANSVSTVEKELTEGPKEVDVEKNTSEKIEKRDVNGLSTDTQEILTDKNCVELAAASDVKKDVPTCNKQKSMELNMTDVSDEVVKNRDDGNSKGDVDVILLDDRTGSDKNKEQVKENVPNSNNTEAVVVSTEKADNQNGMSTVKQLSIKDNEMKMNLEGVADQKVNENKDDLKGHSNTDDGAILPQKNSTPTDNNQDKKVQESVSNSNKTNSEVLVVPTETKDNDKSQKITGEKDVSKISSKQTSEMERLDKLQALTDDLMKAIPATKSGETIFISDVQISSEYCGLVGKGHYNGMDFRWIVQFARPYVNTLITHRQQECANGKGSYNEIDVKPRQSETSTQALSSIATKQNTSLQSKVASAASDVNLPSTQTSTTTVETVTAVFDSEEINFVAAPTTQVAACPSLTGFPVNSVQPVAATPVALSQSTVATPSTAALLQMLPVERPALPTLSTLTSMVQSVQPVATNILLNQCLQPIQKQTLFNGFGLSTIAQNSTVCVPAVIGGSNSSQIATMPHINAPHKDFRPLLPKSPPGFVTLQKKNVAVMNQEVVFQSGYTQQQLYTIAAASPFTNNNNCAIVPTSKESNQLPSEARTLPINLDCQEEPNKKIFYRLDDCLQFEAGEIVLFNNDIQSGRIPKHNQKKLFRCKVCVDEASKKSMDENATFLNSIYNIKKLYITGHLPKTIYQKLIPLTQILTCSWIPLHVKHTYTFLVETLLSKRTPQSSPEDVARAHILLLDVLKKSTKLPKCNAKLVTIDKPEPPTESISAKNDEEPVKKCVLKICLTDLKLPKNQSTVLVTEKKDKKNGHIGFVIKNKMGPSFKKDIFTKEQGSNKKSQNGDIQEHRTNENDGGDNDEVNVTSEKKRHNSSSDSKKRRPRKQQLRTDMKDTVESNGKNEFITPDETDPEIEFSSPSPTKKRKKSGK